MSDDRLTPRDDPEPGDISRLIEKIDVVERDFTKIEDELKGLSAKINKLLSTRDGIQDNPGAAEQEFQIERLEAQRRFHETVQQAEERRRQHESAMEERKQEKSRTTLRYGVVYALIFAATFLIAFLCWLWHTEERAPALADWSMGALMGAALTGAGVTFFFAFVRFTFLSGDSRGGLDASGILGGTRSQDDQS
ncbi:MAG: hypothetical protein ABIP48_12510 [Planctomycetota bacterium]